MTSSSSESSKPQSWYTTDIPLDSNHFREGTVFFDHTHFFVGTIVPGGGMLEERVLCLARNPEKVPQGVDFAMSIDNRADQITCNDCLFWLQMISSQADEEVKVDHVRMVLPEICNGVKTKHQLKVVRDDTSVTDIVKFLCFWCPFSCEIDRDKWELLVIKK